MDRKKFRIDNPYEQHKQSLPGFLLYAQNSRKGRMR